MTDAAIPPHDAHMLASARVIYAMETIISAECLDALIQVAVDELVRDLVPQHENAEAVLKTKWSEVQEKWKRCARHAAEDPVLLREIYQLVCAVVVHFLRENHTELCANDEELALFGFNVPSESEAITSMHQCFLNLIAKAIPKIQPVLQHTSWDFSHVVDISWRLDYEIRSSTQGDIRELLCLVELVVQKPATRIHAGKAVTSVGESLEKKKFACSVEQLRELVYQIQEARQQIEQLSGSDS
ncbi:unnamed protein product [Albugo candida]|uniref:COMM domain-containing protein 3 n=1 Tax=Albugo candida TaxID=65357 RepID=A0A024GA28_9STRA|nr:unnamed protein product [Albugo candida]|eukprot:CCI43504.1 unnamed protein product [Albugo candida]